MRGRHVEPMYQAQPGRGIATKRRKEHKIQTEPFVPFRGYSARERLAVPDSVGSYEVTNRKERDRMEPLTQEQLAQLAKADSPTVANVLELFGIRSHVAGYTNHTLKAVYPDLPPAVGYAVTATFRAGYPAAADDVYGGMPQLIDAAGGTPVPRMAVFQDLDDPVRAATYGEVMATTFQ